MQDPPVSQPVQTPQAGPLTRAVENGARSMEEAAQAAGISTHWLERVVMGNEVRQWMVAGGVLLAVLLLFAVVRPILVRWIRRITARTQTRVDDTMVLMVQDLRLWWIGIVAIYAASRVLVLPEGLGTALRLAAVVATGFQLLILGRRAIDFGLHVLMDRNKQADGTPDPSVLNSLGVVRFLLTLGVGIAILLLALDNMGVKVTPLLTGLGIGGIAIALAVQNILSDIFGSLTIVLDKPFQVGDTIKVGDQVGTVERIGIKTTRLRALSGEELIFSNADLLGSRVQNFKRMTERRVVFTIGVTYETSPEKLRTLPAMIKEAVEHNDVARFDRCHFKGFGAYSLDFETVYFVKNSDFMAYMNAQQAINLELFERFGREGIEFAYPTQVEIVKGDISKREAPTSPSAAR